MRQEASCRLVADGSMDPGGGWSIERCPPARIPHDRRLYPDLRWLLEARPGSSREQILRRDGLDRSGGYDMGPRYSIKR